MHTPAKAAVRAGDNVFAADHRGETRDALGHEFRVLNQIGRVADDAG